MAVKKDYFEPVDLKVNFPEAEQKLLTSWYKKGVVKKYLEKNKSSKDYFSFLDGPITANNPMGVHHAWGRTYKDLWQRFKNMQGYRQRFQNGFDSQGLWVEVEVEKELGFKNKKDIESFGIEKFVNLCRERVKKFSKIQTEQSKRLGYFMDWEHSYYTLSEDNNYMIWHFLKVVFENGWLYKGNDSVPWCPRCETAISQHEMLTEDYKEVTHESIYLSFPIVGRENEYLLVWTTTPWTVPANIAIAVDVKLDYAKVEVGQKMYWVAKEAVARLFEGEKYKIVKEVKGDKLVGWKYKGAFDELPNVSVVAKKNEGRFHIVVPTDSLIMPITTSEGTGLVHTAVSAGTEDFKLGQKLSLPMIPVIEDDASYVAGLGFLSGQNAKKHPEIIFDYLANLASNGEQYFYKTENYTHRYPACWRCKAELVWKVTDEWYISMDKPSRISDVQFPISNEKGKKDKNNSVDSRTLRQRMIGVAKKINWMPAFGLDRELDWLNNMHDWLISKKNRYWGLALPIWECKKCHRFEVVGSKDELKEKAEEGWKDFEKYTPHKPHIDKVKIKCPKCSHMMLRIEPVGNPWLDAGIVPFSTISDNNEACNFDDTETKPLYEVDKKKWLKWYPVNFITESFPGQFKNWFYSMIAMSTVLQDREPFKNVLGFATLLAEDGRPMHKSWGNAISFDEGADKIGADVMRWMYVRQNPTDNLLFGYKVADETRRKFHLKLWNICNFFVTYANLDSWVPLKNLKTEKLKNKSTNILDRWILARLNQMIFAATESLEKFDAYTGSGEIEKFVDDFSLWYIRRSRDRIGPAAESEKDKTDFYETTYSSLLELVKVLAPFTPFLADEIYQNLSRKESVHLTNWPKAKQLSNEEQKLISQMQTYRSFVEVVHSVRKESALPVRQPLNSLETTYKKPTISGIEDIVKEEVNVKAIKWEALKGDKEIVKLDTKPTKELEEEMKARDLIRKIQEERKNMGLNLTQKIVLTSDWWPQDTKLTQWICKKAQIAEVKEGSFKVAKSS